MISTALVAPDTHILAAALPVPGEMELPVNA